MNASRLVVTGIIAASALSGCAESAQRSRPVVDSSPMVKPANDDNFLEQYAATNRYRLGRPSRVSVVRGGDSILFLRSGPRDFSQDLYSFDPTTGNERVLLSATDLLGGAEEELSAEELARRERTRSSARGIASYRLSEDGKTLLVPLSGDLYVVRRTTGTVKRLQTSDDELGPPIDPQLSPDATKVACVRDGDLYVIDISSGSQLRLTETATDTVTNATAEFVAQEEMSRRHGYWWSADSSMIAYQENDESGVELLSIMDPMNPGTPPRSWRYPRAGTPNAKVRLGVIPANGGVTTWVQWDTTRYEYLATVKWPDNAPLTILVQNRHQTEEVVLSVDPQTGETTPLLVETDDAWIDLNQHFPHWLEDGSGFLWATAHRGGWQIEKRSRSGDLLAQLNSPDAGLLDMVHVDEDVDRAYVVFAADPTQRQLGTLSLNALSPEPIGALTSTPGLHSGVFGKDTDLMVQSISPERGPVRLEVARVQPDGIEAIGTLRSVAEQPSFVPRPEWTMTQTTPAFAAVVIRPRQMEPGKRYPVILHVYAGPTSQMVMRSQSRYRLQQWMADQGYIVVSIDGRGTPARGHDWERVAKGDVMSIPLTDQVDGLRSLSKQFPEMDLSHVGIFGWSFGGYTSAMAAMRRPDMFQAAVAGAPVCDWLDYDTHYTERYLGVPPEDQAAYDISNVLTYTDGLAVPLLIIHGTADDNVYLTHSLKMSNALFRAGKPHEFLPLAGFTHMVTEPEVVREMYARIIAFFDQHLKPSASQAVAQ